MNCARRRAKHRLMRFLPGSVPRSSLKIQCMSKVRKRAQIDRENPTIVKYRRKELSKIVVVDSV